jgi:hypothetical protein
MIIVGLSEKMNIKKALICGSIGAISFIIVGAIWSQVLLALVPYFKSGISGTIPPTKMAMTMIWMGIIECLSFALIFDLFYEGIPRQGIQKGLIFGLVLWYINIFLSFLGNYAFGLVPVPDVIFIIVLKALMLPAYGATLGFVCEKLNI